MAEESFPFQELADGDRTVSAAMFAKHISMIRSRGVIKSMDNGLAVSQSSPAAMSVDLDTGAAFAGATQLRAYRNTLARTITIAAADPTDPRHDLVVLDMNTDTGPPDTRRVTTMIVQGTPDPSPSDPALVQTETHYQLALTRVLVGAAVASIVDANITDLRTYSTPFNAPTGGLTREGGNTTEATTTSTSAVDLVSITSLSVATGSPIDARGLARKSGGAASNGGIGLKINATVVSEANATAGHGGAVWTGSTNADRAEAGAFHVVGFVAQTNYAFTPAISTFSAEDTVPQLIYAQVDSLGSTAEWPVATLTSFIFRAISGNASVTVGLDEVHLYSLAVS